MIEILKLQLNDFILYYRQILASSIQIEEKLVNIWIIYTMKQYPGSEQLSLKIQLSNHNHELESDQLDDYINMSNSQAAASANSRPASSKASHSFYRDRLWNQESSIQESNLVQESQLHCFGNPYLTGSSTTVAQQMISDEIEKVLSHKGPTKNIAKNIGNRFQQYCMKNVKQKPPALVTFCQRRKGRKQGHYRIIDFVQLFNCPQSNEIFRAYATNILYVELVLSNRVLNPVEYISFIDHYIAGTFAPKKFVSNRGN